jgi:acetyl esterase/lipase
MREGTKTDKSCAILAFIALLSLALIGYLCCSTKFSSPETITDVIYDSDQRKGCRGDIYEPSLEEGSLAPAVIVVHGGSWMAGSKGSIETRAVVEKLVAEQFVVFDIDYRLHDEGGAFPGNLEDILKAIAYLQENALKYNIDGRQLYLLGISAGAHLSLLAAYNHNHGRPRLNGVIGIASPTDLSTLQIPFVATCFAKADVAPSGRASPVSFATSGIPTLLIHGTADPVIPFAQSQLLAVALTKAHVPVQLVALKGAGHNFICTPGHNQDQALREIVRYLKTQMMLAGYWTVP